MGSLRERNPSLWVATTEPGDYPPLEGDATADVVVVGAGIAGLTTARLLVEQGASVVVIDAGPVAAGATGYTTAKVTSLHGLAYSGLVARFGKTKARQYADANEFGIREMERIITEGGIECGFQRAGHVAFTTDPRRADAVRREAEVAASLGLPAVEWMPSELPFEVAAGVRFDGQAMVHPRAYCLALAREITARGSRVVAHTRALGVDTDERRVMTDRGRLSSDSVVVATHLPINQMGGYFARTEAWRSYAIAVSLNRERPTDMYIGVDDPVRSMRRAGDLLVVGGEGHKVGQAEDTEGHYRRLEDWAVKQFGPIRVEHRWSAQDWSAADGVPFIGRMPGTDGVYVATAFRKWGMAQGTAAGRIISDLIAGRDNPWLSVFDASRFAPKQSLRSTVTANVDVVRHLVGDRLQASRSDAIDRLEPGRGCIVRDGARPVAVFRDDDGQLSAVSAKCTHLGCLVSFNQAERSWDCPCHGSRFACDGRVLEGPAVRDLDRLEVPES